MAQKTIGGLDAATTPLDGTEKVEIEQSAASKRTTIADIRGQGISVKTASYTILDVDADVFEFDGASADGTFTGPTLAANFGRVLEIHNVDPTYKLTFDPEGAETIDGNASVVLPSQYNYLKVRGGTTCWHLIEYKAHGSHATNGEYFLHSNGRLECEVVMNNTADGPKTWTFPKTFADVSKIVCTGNYRTSAGGNVLIAFATPTTTTVSFAAIQANTGTYYGSAEKCALRATGMSA